MKINTALQIGEYHLNHCEDYLFVGETGKYQILCAIMDGCTMATESYFASTLIGKLLRKIAKQRNYKETYNSTLSRNAPSEDLKEILKELFADLNKTRNELMLDARELMSTILIVCFDTKSGTGSYVAIGDGVITINNTILDFDQNNRPDYLGYHLKEDFEQWYQHHKQKGDFSSAKLINLASDGIQSFTAVQQSSQHKFNAMEYLLFDEEYKDKSPDSIELKLKKLEHEYGLKPADDFAMIQLHL